MSNKAVVLDANILIRAVLGTKVRTLIFEYASSVKFFAPDVAYADARKYLPLLLDKRGIQNAAAMKVLDVLETVVAPIEQEFYAGMRDVAHRRIAARDADDWPVLACALTIGCPIWTEDADFFGAGVATWTTDRIALYFA